MPFRRPGFPETAYKVTTPRANSTPGSLKFSSIHVKFVATTKMLHQRFPNLFTQSLS